MSSASVLFDAPGPRARVRNHVISAVTVVVTLLVIWVIYSRLESKGQLTAAKWEPFLSANLWTTYILPGVQGTLTAAAVSIVLALVLGFVLGVGRLSSHNGDPLVQLGDRGVLPRGAGADHDDLRVFPVREVRRVPVETSRVGGRHHGSDAVQRRRHRRDRACRCERAAPRAGRRRRPRWACAGGRPCGRSCCRRPSPRCCRC